MTNVVALYWGWITSGAIATICVALVYVFDMTQRSATTVFWILIPLVMVLVFLKVRNEKGDQGIKSMIALYLPLLWTVYGAVTHGHGTIVENLEASVKRGINEIKKDL